MSKRASVALCGVFCAFIALFFAVNLILPDRDFSEQENRQLSGKPEFSFKALFSGDFTEDFEAYVTDQFALRDRWITLKARCELLWGKSANNGVCLCDGGTLIEGFAEPDKALLDTNLAAVNALAENSGVPVYFALIPGAAELYSELLPEGAPNASQLDVIDSLYGGCAAATVDMYGALSSHTDEYIFYRTDHHWTSLGAYYGYTALAEAMGFTSFAPEHYAAQTVSEEFYGTLWSSSGFTWVEPDEMRRYVTPGDALAVTNYPEGKPVEGRMYDYSALEAKDKYKFFFGGNTPLMTIDTGLEDAPSLLVIRDSYADSLTPFLTEHFSRIHVIDLRYYRMSLAAYIEENDIDEVLVMYSVVNFSTDKSVFLAGR